MGFAKSLFALGFVTLVTLPLGQVQARAAGAVNVTSDSMEIIDSDHKTIFRGHVVATRLNNTIQADEMVVSSSQQKQSDGTSTSVTDFVNAKGNVTIKTRDAVITGDTAKFDILKDQLTVGGDVKVVQGQSVVRGQKLDVNMKNFHLQMSGGRVQGNFVPK